MLLEATARFAEIRTAGCTAELAEYKGDSGNNFAVGFDLATKGCQIDLFVGHILAEER